MNRKEKKFYFTTRELIMMSAFAAVGGIASSYINMIGDFFQSFLGFSGTTQWASGLHVVWLMLAAVIVRKPGAASTVGILKGAVEFFSGNTHGLLVLIVDILAGLLIDLIFHTNRKKLFNIWFYLAAGISSASNIFVFQIFASIPSDVLTFLVIGAASFGAFISGVIFGGILVRSIYKAVQKAGFIHEIESIHTRNKYWPIIISVISLCSMFALGYLYFSQQAVNQNISISGYVISPYELNIEKTTFDTVHVKKSFNGIERSYHGTRLSDIIDKAQPKNKDGLVLINANDGYNFFITLEEVYKNSDLILATQKINKNITMNVVGASSQKAWVRGISKLIVTENKPGIKVVCNEGSSYTFLPQEWQLEMDSFFITMESGSEKLQGVPLLSIIDQVIPNHLDYQVEVISLDGEKYSISSDELFLQEDKIRIFILTTDSSIEFILGSIDGEVLGNKIIKIEVTR
jgi:ABC-type thiamin/hydroxymethylpyrimidine transport system permease subunit